MCAYQAIEVKAMATLSVDAETIEEARKKAREWIDNVIEMGGMLRLGGEEVPTASFQVIEVPGLTLEICENFCKATLTSAAEGGSSYWMEADAIVRTAEHDVERIVSPKTSDDGKELPDITCDTIREGVRRMMVKGADVGAHVRVAALSKLVSPESTGCDKETADCIVQFGVFGKLVYG